MRATRSQKQNVVLPIRQFGWDRFAIATTRHSTLPWTDARTTDIALEGQPLGDLRSLGSRDRLSLTGQYAAHQSYLRFAGIAETAFDPEDWMVVLHRGWDARLVRIRAGATGSDADTPPINLIEQFAAAVEAKSIATLHQSWARAEAVYHDVALHLRDDAAADLRWFRQSATGSILAPGAAALRAAFFERTARLTSNDEAIADSFSFAASLGESPRVLIVGEHGSPLQRYSAISALQALAGVSTQADESVMAEAIAARLERERFAVVLRSPQSYDGASRRVLQMLTGFAAAVWVMPDDAGTPFTAGVEPAALPDTQRFVLSPGAVARRDLEDILTTIPAATRDVWLSTFICSDDYLDYLDRGTLPSPPPQAAARIEEPRRSYLGALALLGTSISNSVATTFLSALGYQGSLEVLAVEGVADVGEEDLRFASDSVRDELANSLQTDSRKALSGEAVAHLMKHGMAIRAAFLLLDTGDRGRAISILEGELGAGRYRAEDVIAALESIPRAVLSTSSALTRLLADSLTACGRYRDAIGVADGLPAADAAVAKAAAERRTGDYVRALERLRLLSSEERTFRSELLAAELTRLQGGDARPHLERAIALADGDEERLRAGYEQSIYALDRVELVDESWVTLTARDAAYLVSRYRTYIATDGDHHDEACAHATASMELAATLTERIDASLDLLFGLFLSGRWDETRHVALKALALVEETQGDRAAGGILFTLAYLCADNGQWSAASQRIERLRTFFNATNDHRRLLEIALLEAHLSFCRGHLEDAMTHAARIATEPLLSLQLREAANLILDECDWMEGRRREAHSSGDSRCVELNDRHHLALSRTTGDMSRIQGLFTRELAQWEQNRLLRLECDAPESRNGSDRLKLFRSASGLSRRTGDAAIRAFAIRLGTELGITIDPLHLSSQTGAGSQELKILRSAAVADFPYGADTFDSLRWCFATRNRLGHWSQIGSTEPFTPATLDGVAADGARGWVECSEREYLFLGGVEQWQPESRAALNALFRLRSEHYRLARVAEQEVTSTASKPETVDGIVGESEAMKEVFEVIARVARRDVPVCVMGESGTGKELIARALHSKSPRRGKVFTPVNCAALPENLIESELFGHVRGAFTGADRDRPGLIETSDGGTLFLDEIGEMPLPAQAKLLRFLQEGEFRRVGDTVNRTADVRLVSATNRKLEQAVDEGSFREDLYYRIRGVEVVLPPLRERLTDILLIARHALLKEFEKHKSGPKRISGEVESVFLSYSWPGNIRELQNTIRAAHAIAGDAGELTFDHLPERLRQVGVVRTAAVSYHDEIVRFRKTLIERSLRSASGNQNQAARQLGMSRQALAYQIRELGIMIRPSM